MRDSAVFGRAFLDGFTMAGLFTKLDRPGASEIDFSRLASDPTITVADIKAAAGENRRAYQLAMRGMICGALASMTCIGTFAYLVVHSHQVIAGTVISIPVLITLGDLIRKYLQA